MRASHPLMILVISSSLFILACNQSNKDNATEDDLSEVQKTCIDNILDQDEILGEKRNHDCEVMPLSETIKLYVAGLDGLDFTNCPEAFSVAFSKHKDAWLAMIPITDNYPDLRGEMHDLFDVIEQGENEEAFSPALKTIWDTWAEVEAAMQLE